MPILSATPAGANDWYGSAIQTGTGSTATNFSQANGGYGAEYDEKTALQSSPLSWIGYVEMEIPEDAVISGVRVTFTRRLASGSNVRFRAGLLARDGTWDVSGFTTVTYPTVTSLGAIHPVMRPLSDYEYYNARWHDSNFVEDTHATGSSGTYTVGEGLSVTYEETGYISFVQEFVDDTTTAHRAFSASGTAIPMLWCFTNGIPLNTDAVQYGYTADSVGNEPTIEVDYYIPGGSIRGKADIDFAASARPDVTASASGKADMEPAATARTDVIVAAWAQADVTSATSKRGDLE